MKKQELDYSIGIVPPKFTIEEWRELLNKNGDNFSDEALIEIRDVL
jgi:hypothetical protein